MRFLVLVCPLTQYGGAFFLEEETPGPCEALRWTDHRRVGSEFGRFSCPLECETSMRLLSDASKLAPFSDVPGGV